ncbi:MAG: beta-1,6-N-acetylglucosaminyltransferase [Paracoccaceae bacterium]
MTLAIALLADKNLDRVAQLARHISKSGVNICIHIDANISLRKFDGFCAALSDCANIRFSKRTACEWGQFSLVEAELQMCRDIFVAWPETGHIQLISGDSLPLKPIDEMVAYLTEHPETDFIESVAIGENAWIVDGLGIERFTMHFPFSWKKQRRLFDTWVNFQRVLGVKRSIPVGLKPYVGSQWWCLSRNTIQAILNDPLKSTYDAYFQKCWIPDESYFQTLVRKHGHEIEAKPLLYSHFDHQGKPMTFYDDHADVLLDLDVFFIRKIWPGADELYTQFLSPHQNAPSSNGANLNQLITLATERRRFGRTGLRMQGRAPNQWHESQPATAVPYQVFSGINAVFPDFNNWFQIKTPQHIHGPLFAKECIHFAGATQTGPGGLANIVRIRDASPDSFLHNLVWETRDTGLAFHFETDDLVEIEKYLAQDPNARIFHLEYSWILDLMHMDIRDPEVLQSRAIYLRNREQAFLARLHGNTAECTLTRWTLSDAFNDPASILSDILIAAGIENQTMPMLLPELAPFEGVEAFAQQLKNIGVDIDSTFSNTSSIVSQTSDPVQAIR